LHMWEARWIAVREKDGLEFRGRLTFSEEEIYNAQRYWTDFKREIIQMMLNTMRDYAYCECKVWYDERTRETYVIECEKHAAKGPSEGEGTSETTGFDTYGN
jgi:hypothetical protein